nr:MAG TPA: hypothetical protein [Caudoviricetes sp.]
MICFLYIHGEGTPTKRKLRQEDKTEIMVREHLQTQGGLL